MVVFVLIFPVLTSTSPETLSTARGDPTFSPTLFFTPVSFSSFFECFPIPWKSMAVYWPPGRLYPYTANANLGPVETRGPIHAGSFPWE